jgi:hypothetical protein
MRLGLVVSSILTGCGARTSLYAPDLEEGGFGGLPGTATVASSSTGAACTDDRECDDGVECTIDTCGADGCENAPDVAFCSDGLLCTVDLCDTSAGCQNLFSNDSCDDGVECTTDICDSETDSCLNEPCDALCDNGSFCDGVERCDSNLGCVSGTPSCELGLGCETSSCNETTDLCAHQLPPGCFAPDIHLLVTASDGSLLDVTPFGTPTQVQIAPPGVGTHLDVAILGNRWFAIQGDVVELAPFTNLVMQNLGPLPGNSLGAGPDGWLYAADTFVRRMHPTLGTVQMVGPLPAGHSSSGDIAFLGDRMFVSTDSGCGGALVEFDVVTGTGVVLGGDGLGCVYGLAAAGGALFVVNCDGKIGTFDPDIGDVKIFATTPALVYGADRLP